MNRFLSSSTSRFPSLAPSSIFLSIFPWELNCKRCTHKSTTRSQYRVIVFVVAAVRNGATHFALATKNHRFFSYVTFCLSGSASGSSGIYRPPQFLFTLKSSTPAATFVTPGISVLLARSLSFILSLYLSLCPHCLAELASVAPRVRSVMIV